MIPVSVYIITKNCEETLHNTLASVADFAEIILVDSGSTDKTIEIAQAFNCKIYHQAWLGFAKQKQLALDYCQSEWVLNLDGAEFASELLKTEIKQCIADNQLDGLKPKAVMIRVLKSTSRLRLKVKLSAVKAQFNIMVKIVFLLKLQKAISIRN